MKLKAKCRKLVYCFDILLKAARLLPIIGFIVFFFPRAQAHTAGSDKEVVAVVNRAFLDNCLELINSAKSTVSIAHFYYKRDDVTTKIGKAINTALARHVKVRILLDGSVPDNEAALKEFASAGAAVKLFGPKAKLHAKFIIADNSVTLIGSTNFSGKSIVENNETNVLIKDPRISEVYQEYFENLWDGNDKGVSDSFIWKNPKASVIPVLGKNYLGRSVNLINKSKYNIGVILYMAHFTPQYYSSKPNILLRALNDAKRRGVRVRVILEKSDFDNKLNEMNKSVFEYLSENKIEIKYDSPDIVTHAKLLLCDNSALLGSTNWVIVGLEKNKEANIMIRETDAVNAFWKYFEDLWSKY